MIDIMLTVGDVNVRKKNQFYVNLLLKFIIFINPEIFLNLQIVA